MIETSIHDSQLIKTKLCRKILRQKLYYHHNSMCLFLVQVQKLQAYSYYHTLFSTRRLYADYKKFDLHFHHFCHIKFQHEHSLHVIFPSLLNARGYNPFEHPPCISPEN